MQKHNRRSIRLKGYDYSQPGAYFVTIVTQNREFLFGDVINGKMVLNAAGLMIQNIWNELPKRFSNIEMDETIVMPNHFHGIIKIVGQTPTVTLNNDSEINNGAGARPVPAVDPQNDLEINNGAGTRPVPTDVFTFQPYLCHNIHITINHYPILSQ